MPSVYPNGIDSFANPTSSSPLTDPRHSRQHSQSNDAIIALETKVGINNSGDPDSLDYRVTQLEEGGGGGGGGAGESARVLYFVIPAGGGDSTPLPLTQFEATANAGDFISVNGDTGTLDLEPGIYVVDLTLILKVGVTDPPILTMESTAGGLTQVFAGGFSAINDTGGDWNGTRTGTFYVTTAGSVSLRYNGSHADISSGLVTVVRLRDI